jgi:hypothetical protein
LSKKIFDLTVKTLQTKNQRVIDEVLSLYDQALKLADNPNHSDLNRLRKIKHRLETIYNRQRSANESRQVLEKHKRRRRIWQQIKLWSALIIALSGIIGYTVLNVDFSFLAKKPVQQQTAVELDAFLIEQYINQWEQRTGQRVWQWRRQKIMEELNGRKMPMPQAEKIIDSLISKAWK